MQLTDNIFYTYCKMEMEVWGIVYLSTRGTYHIGINDRLSPNIQTEVLNHELKHIKYDLPNQPYIIGFNMQYIKFEKEADLASNFLVAML